MKKKSIFEHTTCGKCGGDGIYHGYSGYGKGCFGCHGRGYNLTRRGAKASAFLYNLLSKPVTELVPGDKYFYQGFNAGSYVQPSMWVTVEEVVAKPAIEAVGGEPFLNGRDPQETLYFVKGDKSGYGHLTANESFRVAHTNEEKRKKQLLALAYQSFLNKNGTPNIKAILSGVPVDASLAQPYAPKDEVVAA